MFGMSEYLMIAHEVEKARLLYPARLGEESPEEGES